jgi:hypothetical protein
MTPFEAIIATYKPLFKDLESHYSVAVYKNCILATSDHVNIEYHALVLSDKRNAELLREGVMGKVISRLLIDECIKDDPIIVDMNDPDSLDIIHKLLRAKRPKRPRFIEIN